MKKLIVILVLLLSFILHIAQDKIPSLRFYQIDFFLIYAVVAVLMLNSISALFLALLAGGIQDSLSGSILGINAMAKFTVSYVILLITRWIDINIRGIAILLFLLACLIDFAIIFLTGKWFNLFTLSMSFDKFIIKYTINSAAGYLLYIIIKHLTTSEADYRGQEIT